MFAALLLPLALASSLFAQGSAAGYGQGGQQGGRQFIVGGGGQGGGMGGGGGFGGGRGAGFNAPEEPAKAPRPDDDVTPGLWQSRTAILTPGDKVEFKLKMKKGETLFAAASSDTFDAALSLDAGPGKVLAKNDDRVEGDQSPFISYRFENDGEYSLNVLSFHSAAGGKFTLKMRTFFAVDGPTGKSTHEAIVPIQAENQQLVMVRIHATKGKFYRLTSAERVVRYGAMGLGFRSLVGPSGVAESDYDTVPTPDGTIVFEALADGDYYAEYDYPQYQGGESKLITDIREIVPIAAKAAGSWDVALGKDDLGIVTFPVEANQIVHTRIGGSGQSVMSEVAGDFRGVESEGAPYGDGPFWAWFKASYESTSDLVRSFHLAGKVRIAVRSFRFGTVKVTVQNEDTLPAWTAGTTLKSPLKIGEAKLFLMKSTKSELMRVFATADHFLTRLDIFFKDGRLANSLCNRSTNIATDDLYFPDAGEFIVRLSCEGDGGSGEYTMKRESLTPAPYAMGTVQTMKFDGANFGLYEVDLVAGKRYELMTDNPQNPLRVDLLDEDGQFLVSQHIVFDKVDLQYFIPTRSGKHRLWIRGNPGTWHFKFELHKPPTLAGG